MNYYYDVLLNFQDVFYMFYEWDESDNIEFIKKIPLFHVDTQMISDAISNTIELNKNFLEQICDKTKLKQNKILNYACIISDGKNNIAIECNNNGLIINKSSLTIEDELNINEFIYTINKSKIDYKIISKCKSFKETRQELKIKKFLDLEIKDIYNKKNYSKLKYIYLEWFNEILDNNEVMYNNMLNKIKDKLSSREYHIYELIKLNDGQF